MLKRIDNLLNFITMYRLMLYYLTFLISLSIIFSAFKLLPYDPLVIILFCSVILFSSIASNKLLATLFKAPSNVESVYITALILTLIITPVFSGTGSLLPAIFSSIIAMASKYLIAIKKKHLFNPAAFSAVISFLVFNHVVASWWIGNPIMALPVLAGGLLIVRKLRRFDLVLSFFLLYFSLTGLSALLRENDLVSFIRQTIIYSPTLFFAFVMLTEPMTTPPTKNRRMIYGGLTGIIYANFLSFAGFNFTPEMALLAGNVFSYLVSSKQKLVLKFRNRIQEGKDTYDFIFETDRKLAFAPGQYLEWTLIHPKFDNRGIRRYFTLASSPTEQSPMIGVKFYDRPSTFKQHLLALEEGHQVVAAQLSGDFTLPKDKTKKLVFIAGGIGVTPFRSMTKYLLDTKEKRDIVLLYSNKTAAEICYRAIYDQAEKEIGLKAIYTLTDQENIPTNWSGLTEKITGTLVTKYVPDYRDRIFYISGPQAMVTAITNSLIESGIKRSKIKTDYFPGF